MNATEECAELLKAWDEKSPVGTVEMGGISPGYEQTIQVVAMELIRALNGKDLPKDDKALNAIFDAETHRLDRELDLGLSGAQAGAAKQLAYRFMSDGPKKAIESAGADRRILVSKHWPKTP